MMEREAGLGRAAHESTAGHNEGGSSSLYNYRGMGVGVKFEAVSKLEVNFL